MYSQLIYMISRLIHRYSLLISGLAVSFSRYVFNFELNSSFLSSEAMIVHIDGVCIGLGESYGL